MKPVVSETQILFVHLLGLVAAVSGLLQSALKYDIFSGFIVK